MKKIVIACALLMSSGAVWAAGGAGFPLQDAPIDLRDKASLQRGAKAFVSYCMGCHSLEHQRYNRLAKDIGMTEEQAKSDLILTGAKIGETMKNAMPKAQAKQWFGVVPPDLTLIARSRGVDYLYTYLLTFYEDASRPFGFNNAVFPNAGMPHVLWNLQGTQKPVFETHKDSEGNDIKTLKSFELVQKGSLPPAEYKKLSGDIVNFLAYVGEPIQLERQRIGLWVMMFLSIALVVFYLLKKEYWKDVH